MSAIDGAAGVFFGPLDALSRTLTHRFAGEGIILRHFTHNAGGVSTPPHLRSLNFLDRDAISTSLTGTSPEVALIYPGWHQAGKFVETSSLDWQAALQHNVEAVIYILQSVGERMLEANQSGRIILISHVAALTPFQGLSVLGTTLGALKALIRMVALELSPHAITVNAVAVGPTSDAGVALSSAARSKLTRDTPLGPLDPQAVADVCIFLASEAAAPITGQTLPVDNGFLLTRGQGVSPFAQWLERR